MGSAYTETKKNIEPFLKLNLKIMKEMINETEKIEKQKGPQERIYVRGEGFIEVSVGTLSGVDIDKIKSGGIKGQSSFIELALDNDNICHDFFFETIDEISIVQIEEDEEEEVKEIFFDDFEENGIIVKEETPEKISDGNIVLVNPDDEGLSSWDDDHIDLSKLEIKKCIRTYPDGSEIEGFLIQYNSEPAVSDSLWNNPEVNICIDGEWEDYAW